MRRLLITVLVLVVTLTVTSVAAATESRSLRSLENAVELEDGTGLVIVNLRGALIGSMGSGTLTITDYAAGVDTEISVQNASVPTRIDGIDGERLTYQCDDSCRFRIFRGRWKVRLEGRDIYASFAGDGTFGLAGPEGRYSFAGAPYRLWPTEWQVVKLGD